MGDSKELETIDQAYRLLLGRQMNDNERKQTVERLKSDQGPLDVEAFRRDMIKSEEFVAANREIFLPTLFPKPCVVVARTPLGHELYADLRQLHLGFAIANGAFEPAETAYVMRKIKRGMHVCDIGANIGYYSMIFAALVGNEGAVHSFEPVSESFQKLTAAVARNKFENIVSCHRIALLENTGEIHIAYELDGANIGAAHLLTDGQGRSQSLTSEVVAGEKLDDVLDGRRVDFIKIDVEGAEIGVLKGAEALLTKHKPTILIEFNAAQLNSVSSATPADLAQQLTRLGYTLHEILPDGTTSTLRRLEEDVPRLLEGTGIFNCIASATD